MKSKIAFILLLTITFPGFIFSQGNSWVQGDTILTARVAPGAATVGHKIFVIGGFTDISGASSVVEAFDSVTGIWSGVASLPTARGRLAVAVNGDTIYAVGGFGDQTAFEAYNTVSNAWSAKPDILQGRLGAIAGVIGGKLYVIGGTTADSIHTVEEYDPAANAWTFRLRMPTPRYLLAGAVIGSKFYTVGGTNSVLGGSALDVLEVYDPASNTWETKAPMLTPRSDLSAAVMDGKLYVAGGFGGAGNPGTALEVYDTVSDSWSTLASMPTSRGDLTSAALGGKLFAIAGVSAPGMTPLATVEIYTPQPASVAENNFNNDISVYPNPAINEFTVSGLQYMSGLIEIYNVVGEKVYHRILHGKQETVSFQPGAGIYFVKVSDREKVYARKLVIQ